jgi:hypothetical protein
VLEFGKLLLFFEIEVLGHCVLLSCRKADCSETGGFGPPY